MSERTQGRGAYTPPADGGADLHRQIDRAYDKAETFVAGLGRILGADTSGGVAVEGGHTVEIGHVTSQSLPAREVKQLPGATIAHEAKVSVVARPFEIIEVCAHGHQPAIWIVTNGAASMRCSSKKIAQDVLDHVQKAMATK